MKLTPINRAILIVFIVFAAFCSEGKAQNNIGLKFFGLSIHPHGDPNAFLMPNKLDNGAYLVMNLGGEIMYEYFIYEDVLSVKGIQALYADCSARLGGFSHLGLRGKIYKKGRHSVYGGIGPTLIFRRNWLDLEGYINLNRFKGDENVAFQYFFVWYGGEFEYKYSMTDKTDLAVSFAPGYPYLMSLAVGVSFNY